MPNHIKNRINLIGSVEDIDKMIAEYGTYIPAKIAMTHDEKLAICRKTDEEYAVCWMDLKTGYVENRDKSISQIGLPDGWEIEIRDAYFSFPDFKKVIPPPDDPAYRDEPNQEIAQHSPNWWHTWNIEHWGTKWGGYSYERLGVTSFTFETAWSSSPEIIETISKQFPGVTIEYTWADEDTGSNCGKAVYKDGLISEDIPNSQSKEAYEIAFELRPSYRDDYELTETGYKYKKE